MCLFEVSSDGSQENHPTKIKISVTKVSLLARPWVLKQNKTNEPKRAPFTKKRLQRSLCPYSTPSGAAS